MTVQVRVERYHTACRTRGWRTTVEQAREIGVSRVMLHRLLAGKQEPSASTITAMLGAFDAPFGEIFEVKEPTA